jgi:hypothetical protein
MVIHLSYSDELEALLTLLHYGCEVEAIMAQHNAEKLAIRAYKDGSNVEAYFKAKHSIDTSVQALRSMLLTGRRTKKYARMLRDIGRDMSNVSQPPSISNCQPISYTKFSLVRVLVEDHMKKLRDHIKLIKEECGICLEETTAFISLHDDERHKVCTTCRLKLKMCPFCRRDLLTA